MCEGSGRRREGFGGITVDGREAESGFIGLVDWFLD
jgi:hypothetical protein